VEYYNRKPFVFSKQLDATLSRMRSVMKNYQWPFAIALSLILGFGSVLASAHSHGEHQDTLCSICVLQPTTAITSVDTAIELPILTAVSAASLDYTIPRAVRTSNHPARAPPHNL